jgi:hypothetical protein
MVGATNRFVLSAGLAFAVLCVVATSPAWAAPPANDSRDNATVIDLLPFTDTLDTTEATIGPEDDAAAVNCGLAVPYPKSVWYRYTPAGDHDVLIGTAGSSYTVGVGVGTGDACVATFPSSGSFSAQAGQTYWIAFVDAGIVGSGGSLQISMDINHAPECEDVAISVETGQSVEVPLPDCVDAEDDEYSVYIEDEPEHGVFDYGTQSYKPSPGFVGQDSMTFRAQDAWGAESELGLITITVTPKPQPSPQPQPQPQPAQTPRPQPDLTAPTLDLTPPSGLKLRDALRHGIRIAVTTNETGRLVVRAFVDRKTARRLRIKKNASRDVMVGSLARDITAGKTTVKVTLSRKARSRMKVARRVKLRIVIKITDPAGNVRTRTLRITLKGKRSD